MREIRIGGAVLASGSSARFGANKLLEDFLGRALVARAFARLPEGGLERRVVVTRWPQVASLARASGLTVVEHGFFDVSDSVRLAVQAMAGLDGALFLVGDQPLLTQASVEKLIAAFRARPDQAARLSWRGAAGNPIVFPARVFPFLGSLAPGETGRAALGRSGVPVRLVEAAAGYEMLDCDTSEALEKCRAIARSIQFPQNPSGGPF
jgi:molybdenum cofactor cytidylyltransferase